MFKKALFGVILLVGVFLTLGQKYFLHADNVDVISNKVSIEERMEGRIKLVLASFLGTDDIISTVRVNLVRSDEDAELNAISNSGKKTIRGWDASEEIILPGVPAANSMVKKDKTKPGVNKVRFGVASINITLFIGKKLNDKTSEKVKEIIVNMFGLDLDAGDILTIESYEPIGKENNKKGMSHLEIILIAFLLLLVYYLLGPFKSFMNVFNQNLLSLGSKSVTGSVGGSFNEEYGAISGGDEGSDKEIHATLLPSGVSGSTQVTGSIVGDEIVSFIKLINNETVEDLKLALANEPGDVIAKIIAYLPSKYALAAIPNHRVTEVLAQYTNVGSDNPEELKHIINRVMASVEGSFGGATRLSKIVQIMDKSSQESILNMLRSKNMEFARNVEKRIFRFEDVLNYEAQHIRRIFRKSGADTFANCLMGQPDAIVQKFYDKLGASITTLIANKLSVVVSNVRNIDAELEVFRAIESLSEKGLIPSIEQIKQGSAVAEQSQF